MMKKNTGQKEQATNHATGKPVQPTADLPKARGSKRRLHPTEGTEKHGKTASDDKEFDIVNVPRGKIVLLKNRCKGCGFCVEFCPQKALEVSEDYNIKGYHIPSVKFPDKCILCGFCINYCPDFAIYQIKNGSCELMNS